MTCSPSVRASDTAAGLSSSSAREPTSSASTPTSGRSAKPSRPTADSARPDPVPRTMSGATCPGRTRSSGTASGSARTRKVRARSAALIPIVIPAVASTVTAGTERRLVPSETIGGRRRRRARPDDIGAHSSPEVCRTIQATRVESAAAVGSNTSTGSRSPPTRMTGRPTRGRRVQPVIARSGSTTSSTAATRSSSASAG